MNPDPVFGEPESFIWAGTACLPLTLVLFSKAVHPTDILKSMNKGWSLPLLTRFVEIQDTMENCLPTGNSLKSFC